MRQVLHISSETLDTKDNKAMSKSSNGKLFSTKNQIRSQIINPSMRAKIKSFSEMQGCQIYLPLSLRELNMFPNKIRTKLKRSR